MLAPPEKGSWSHMKMWIGNQPPDRQYDWPSPSGCACGLYCEENYNDALYWIRTGVASLGDKAFSKLNHEANECKVRTFGALSEHLAEMELA
jgi:hypothetical protein